MPARAAFEYAVIRVVPSIERGEFINAGVVLFCRTRRFLDARIHFDAARLHVLAPDADVELIEELLTHIMIVCKGGAASGPIGELPLQERFRWIAAPRSTVVQSSPVHCGMCDDPAALLEHLMRALVLPRSF
ncbi:MAG TPA: DUF3037 domain-containing protein [Roseiflexaceae bacterium]|jgi:hypothetical protein|nr:DUF3037 domain-containing protein [Roseiflexaceae bacterium]